MFTSASAGPPSAGDIAWHSPVRAATTAALPANTYAAGSPSTLTANANGAFGFIDGYGPAVGDRLLIKDEALQAHNGIYTVADLGSAGTPWVLARAADADTAAEVPQGSIVFVSGGSVNQYTYQYEYSLVGNIDGSNENWRALFSQSGVTRQVYAANATFITPTHVGVLGAMVRCVGGGGAGGGAVLTAAGQGAVGGGGGGGGYAESWIPFASLTAPTYAITVGAGGIAAAGASGGAGGASSFGALVAANGGGGGTAAAASAATITAGGGAGGAGTAGDIQAKGGDAGWGTVWTAVPDRSAFGGGSVLGGTREVAGANTVGQAGAPYGGGGSGAINGASQAARAGGAGAAGVVIVDVYGVG